MSCLILCNSLDQDQTPNDAQRFNGIGKGMCLVGPGHI